jgi:hypothetical protein
MHTRKLFSVLVLSATLATSHSMAAEVQQPGKAAPTPAAAQQPYGHHPAGYANAFDPLAWLNAFANAALTLAYQPPASAAYQNPYLAPPMVPQTQAPAPSGAAPSPYVGTSLEATRHFNPFAWLNTFRYAANGLQQQPTQSVSAR